MAQSYHNVKNVKSPDDVSTEPRNVRAIFKSLARTRSRGPIWYISYFADAYPIGPPTVLITRSPNLVENPVFYNPSGASVGRLLKAVNKHPEFEIKPSEFGWFAVRNKLAGSYSRLQILEAGEAVKSRLTDYPEYLTAAECILDDLLLTLEGRSDVGEVDHA